jgi:hypothetical protein
MEIHMPDHPKIVFGGALHPSKVIKHRNLETANFAAELHSDGDLPLDRGAVIFKASALSAPLL